MFLYGKVILFSFKKDSLVILFHGTVSQVNSTLLFKLAFSIFSKGPLKTLMIVTGKVVLNQISNNLRL